MPPLRVRSCWLAVPIASILIAVACGGDEVEEFVNEGSWCLRQNQDQSLTATAIAPGCFSGSCSDLMSAQCALTRDGSTLTLSSHFRVKHLDSNACTDDCQTYLANCSLGAVPEGQFDLAHGETQTIISVPLPAGGVRSGDHSFFCEAWSVPSQ